MEFLLLFVLPLGGYIVYLVCFADLRTTFERDSHLHSRGVLLYKAGLLVESRAYFADVLRKNPSNATCLYYLGRIHIDEGNTHQALYYLQQAIRYDNTIADAYMLSGRLLMQLEFFEEAAQEFRRATFYLRTDPEPLYLQGRCLIILKQKKAARKCFKAAALLGHEEANFMDKQSLLYTDVM